MKKLLALILLCTTLSLHAQQMNFEQTRTFIKKTIACCAIPFVGGDSMKVSGIEIQKNGDVQIFYSSRKGPLAFNLFDLYSEGSDKGIQAGDGNSRLLLFNLNPEKTKTIRFSTHEEAKKMEAAFNRLLQLCARSAAYSTGINFQQTLDSINTHLGKWTQNHAQLSAEKNGDVVISSKGDQVFSFNLFELSQPAGNRAVDPFGMEAVRCNKKAAAAQAWLNFHTTTKPLAFLKFNCIPDADLQNIHHLFLQLRSLCTPVSLATKPAGAFYFVNHRSVVHSTNNMLLNSIRSADKKDVGDTTILIASAGEGWLDKDSLPIGEWQFFATDAKGREYLFKKGFYNRTTPDLFEVLNSDSNWLLKNHQISFASLKENHAVQIPFIKSGNWNYYHPNGRLWKTVSFQSKQVPVYLDIMISTDPLGNETGSTIVSRGKDDSDEWISRDVKEYDQNGILFKKLEYYSFSEVLKKTVYGPNGEIIREEKAKPYESIVKPENY